MTTLARLALVFGLLSLGIAGCAYFARIQATGNLTCETSGFVWLDAEMTLDGRVFEERKLDGKYKCWRLNGDFDGKLDDLGPEDFAKSSAICTVATEE